MRFSELLEGYIVRSGKNVNQLAKACGFARSYLSLIKNGQRIPTEQKLRRLCTALELSPTENRQLWEGWECEKYGTAIINKKAEFFRLLHMFGEVGKEPVPPMKVLKDGGLDEKEDCPMIFGKEKITMAMTGLLGTGRTIRAVLQEPEVFWRMRAVYPCLSIMNILCLENCGGNAGIRQADNLAVLRECLRVLMLYGQYQPFYYYGSPETLRFSSLPYMVIGTGRMLQISGDMQAALCLSDGRYIRSMAERFDKLKKACKPFWNELAYKDAMENDKPAYEAVSEIYILGSQAFLETLGNYAPWAPSLSKGNTKAVIFFSRRGLIQWMNDGGRLLRGRNNRRVLVRMWLDAIRQGHCKAHCLKESIELPDGLVVTAAEVSPATIRYGPAKKYLEIREDSVSSMLYEVLAWMRGSTYVSGGDETVKIIEEIYGTE